MLGSLEESEDLVQETFLRAWRRRETYAGRSTVRAWLYRIATNACLDALQRRPRRPQGGEVPWLQPYPDELLEGISEPDAEPDAVVAAKETVELAFMVAIQHLPPKTRAVLILRDVLDWPAKDTAALLETSVAAVNSALQRAHAGLKEHLPERRLEWAPGTDPTESQRELLERYIEASDRADAHALAALMREDSTWSMPPEPGLWRGRDAIVASWLEGGMGTAEFGRFRCVETAANLQPAVACYLQQARRGRLPRARDRRAADRGGGDRRHHQLLRQALPGLRAQHDALMRFDRRVVSVPPGRARDYDEADWRDALVLVVRGEIELEARSGSASASRAVRS